MAFKKHNVNFELDDLILYTPNIDALPTNRPHDHGIVVGLDGDYIIMQFTNGYKSKILTKAISFLPCTQKFYKNIFINEVLYQMMKMIETQTARLIFEMKTNMTSELGPFSLIVEFL